MGRVIAVASGKGGVGKTTIVANLGIVLALAGKSVCVVDGDIGLNNLDMVVGIENQIVFDLVDCLLGKCRTEQALVPVEFVPRLFVLPCVKRVDYKGLSIQTFESIVHKLSSQFDFVLIDCPAGIGSGLSFALSGASEVMVVITPHLSSIRDSSKTIGQIKSVNRLPVCVVINKIRKDLVDGGKMMSVEEIEDVICERVIGAIPQCDSLEIYNSFIQSYGSCKDLVAQKAFSLLAQNIVYNRRDRVDGFGKKPSLFEKMFKRR